MNLKNLSSIALYCLFGLVVCYVAHFIPIFTSLSLEVNTFVTTMMTICSILSFIVASTLGVISKYREILPSLEMKITLSFAFVAGVIVFFFLLPSDIIFWQTKVMIVILTLVLTMCLATVFSMSFPSFKK